MATLAAEAASWPDALALASAIVSSAGDVLAHRRNCKQLAGHAELVRAWLEKVSGTDLERVPEIREGLGELAEALREALELVESCRGKSCIYMVATGWNAVYEFRRVQAEIDRRVEIPTLTSLVHEFRMEHLEQALRAIRDDRREYTLDELDIEAQNAILKPNRTKRDADILEKFLYRAYPDLRFDEALQEEREKLHVELQWLRSRNDPKQCRVIEHLIGVAENATNGLPSKRVTKLLVNEPAFVISGYINNVKSITESFQDQGQDDWQADLFGCCMEPCLSFKTCLYPCGMFAKIANAVSRGEISREAAANNVFAFSLVGSCCCYTCCVRRRLRELFNIQGSLCDDFLTHLMCCCCAMVQEWRELELRGFEGCQGRKMIPPPYQFMKP
ncbi:protein MID1-COMPLEMENTING ACTIVITY 1-like isoform X2 [Syzygium oleosum]|uniref:protein MID1-COMPLEMENTING ACTIVITY 1-like isoform X2 n=1 Tax=Syzygium oleosum TaxID=219896 RepID=UPI0011D238C8|nr:protein MID1-COMPLEMENTING ACTIVITY 1-like isoform X2 [Syzygium oleosum]